MLKKLVRLTGKLADYCKCCLNGSEAYEAIVHSSIILCRNSMLYLGEQQKMINMLALLWFYIECCHL